MNPVAIPEVGDRVYHPDAKWFVVKRRTKAEDTIFVWSDSATAFPFNECSVLEPGVTLIRRFNKSRVVHGWIGEVLSIDDSQVEVILLPDKHWDSNASRQLWPISDCIPNPY